MRGIIKFSAGVFILIGAVVFLIAVLMTFGVVVGNPDLSGAGGAVLLIPLAGVLAAASIILVGGTAYLLASIDHRLEAAMKQQRSSGRDPPEPVPA